MMREVPVLYANPTHDVSSTVYHTLYLAASIHPSFEVTGWMLAAEMFSLGRHQMGKHYSLAAIST